MILYSLPPHRQKNTLRNNISLFCRLNIMKIYDFIIEKDKDIKKGIVSYVLEKGWDEALVLGAVGSVKDMLFTTPICDSLPLRTCKNSVPGAGEILSFTGEIMERAKMDPELKDVYKDTECPLFVHIHASMAAKNGVVAGGGLAGGKAFRALRVFIVPVSQK